MEIGGFQLGQQLPGGRFGARWRATGSQGEQVLLKQLVRMRREQEPSFLEAQDLLRAVTSASLARTWPSVSDSAGTRWAVEEWIDGVSLSALQQEHVLSTGQALGVARGVLGGLAALHSSGIAHGLVGPATVMLDRSGKPTLVDSGLWAADREVAETDVFAAPEVAAGSSPTPSADVFSAGSMISGALQAGPVDAGLASVLARATHPDPLQRHPDGAAFLAQLSEAAERAYGPLWWTLEGIGGAVASALGAGAAGAAGTGAAGAGSAGVMSGSLGTGNAAILAGADAGAGGTGVVTGAVRSGSRLRVLIPVLVGVVVIGVAAVALANNGRSQPGALNAPVSTPTPSATATVPSTPTPTPTPPLGAGLNGTYTYESVRTKSNDARFPVGERQTTTWVVMTTCFGETCTSDATVDGTAVPVEFTPTGFTTDLTFPVDCIRFDTQKKVGSVNYRQVRKLSVVTVSDGVITKLSGTSKTRQLKACKIQTIPVGRFEYKVTMTLKK